MTKLGRKLGGKFITLKYNKSKQDKDAVGWLKTGVTASLLASLLAGVCDSMLTLS